MSEIRTSEDVKDIYGALAKAQAKLDNVAKDRENPHFRTRYTTLAGVLDEVRPKLAEQGIAVLQMPVNGEGSNVGIVTRLTHSSGQWIESAIYVAPTKFDAQGVGSVLTYLRRYSLMAVAGVGSEDDDGNAAVGRPQVAQPGPQPRPNGNGVNAASLPPNPVEPPQVSAARDRVRELIAKINAHIKSAPNDHALDLAMEDARDELSEIEKAGPKGVEAANELRARYNAKIGELRQGQAA